jgi:hypothetical protein
VVPVPTIADGGGGGGVGPSLAKPYVLLSPTPTVAASSGTQLPMLRRDSNLRTTTNSSNYTTTAATTTTTSQRSDPNPLRNPKRVRL